MNRTVNCIIVDDEPVAREVMENLLAKLDNFIIVASCKNVVEAFRAINTQHVDLAFLDINMPEISGLSFAKSVSRDIKIIFTTAYREYAVDGFDLKAVDYLLKPISFERLLQAVNKFFAETQSKIQDHSVEIEPEKDNSFFVRSERKMVKVPFREILYIESLSDYIKIHLEDQNTIITRETLSNIEGRIPQQDFMRIHRSFIVSMDKISSYTSDTIELGKHELPISRGFKDGVMERLGGDCSQG